jgi:hypothetical protein
MSTHERPKPPYKVDQSGPAARNYSNDAREGRTSYGKIEIIDREDPRHFTRRGEKVIPNRAAKRAAGQIFGPGTPFRSPRKLTRKPWMPKLSSSPRVDTSSWPA